MSFPNDRFPSAGPPEDDGGEDWLTTYADAITLLMAFFVMMYSASKLDGKKFEDIKVGIETHVTHRRSDSTTGFSPQVPGSPVTAEPVIPTDRDKPKEMIQGSGEGSSEGGGAQSPLEVLSNQGDVSQSLQESVVMLEFSSGALFERGSARLKASARPVLADLASRLRERESPPKIIIEGHTDDSKVRSTRYPSNWELSSARAVSVLRFLVSRGIDPETMEVRAYADTEPKQPNRDPWGNPDPEGRAANRRVVMWIQDR